MKTSPTYKSIEVVAGGKASWYYKNLRCSLRCGVTGVTVRMKGGNAHPGEPGEEFTFFRACKSLPEAFAFAESLPSTFGPDQAQQLGFERTGWALYD